jgi:Uma2 family endonuclease
MMAPMATATKKLTYADYAKLPDDGCRHEIIEGEEFVTPAPNADHQDVVLNIASLLKAHVAAQKLGRVFVAPFDVLLSRHDVVQPDVLFVSKRRASIITKAHVKGAPDLVVEVVSPTSVSIDRVRKLNLYERAGVREYWIVDSAAEALEIHEFGSVRRTRIVRDFDTFASALLPGVKLKASAFSA